jgi:glucokinase
MELGHMSVDPHGRLCNCGNHGCVEMYCSGKGLVAGAKAHLPEYPNTALVHAELNTRAILTAARAGDKLALRVIEEAADVLGQAMAWSAMAFNPTLIVIGGGMAQAADDLLFDRAEAAMRMRLLPDLRPLVTVARSQVESSAVGAAALVWHALAASE